MKSSRVASSKEIEGIYISPIMTGIATFDRTLEQTHTWVNDIAKILECENKEQIFQGLRVTLHKLRDRLTVEEATHLGAQFPVLLTGFYYEDWKPATNPDQTRSQGKFLDSIEQQLPAWESTNISIENLVRAVFNVISSRVSAGEVKQVINMMPTEIKQLWPQPMQAEAANR
ncbi:DUF2267 domain-containing protein [Lyngbya aestuarii]|uniref:DUF2267 domain-containing protein n=1 Tax=Lyngbya aestuarii TaxID=118322 RepID=UPI00193EA031|nr:DUF2267 domain-containing protein [Lyngbya aestuarii]